MIDTEHGNQIGSFMCGKRRSVTNLAVGTPPQLERGKEARHAEQNSEKGREGRRADRLGVADFTVRSVGSGVAGQQGERVQNGQVSRTSGVATSQ